MNVLILNYEYPPLGGGAANATWYLLKELSRKDGLTIDLITSSTSDFHREQPYTNISIHYLDIGKQGNIHYQSNKELLSYAWKSYRYAHGLLRKGRSFDFVHAFFGIPSGYVAMKLGLPYIISLRGSDVPFYNSRFALADKLLFKRLSGRVWKHAEKVVANSEGLRRLANHSHPEIPIAVIPNGVDVDTFTPVDGIPAARSDVHIVSTGRLINRKGYDLLIKAVAGLPRIRITLAGEGPAKESLAILARDHGVRIDFPGVVEHERISALLQSADIFVLPSRNEGMSNSVLEAMACGLPVITTDVGGSRELIDGNGRVIPRDNYMELRRAIQFYLDNPDHLGEHGRLSRSIAESMGWEKVAEKYFHMYSDLRGKSE